MGSGMASLRATGVGSDMASLRAKFGLPEKRPLEQVDVLSSSDAESVDARISITCLHVKKM